MKIRFVIALLVIAPCALFAQSWQYTGAMHSVRWLAEMASLDNNTALIIGGYDENFTVQSSCEIYDPATASWSLTGSLNVARVYPTIVKLANGHVLTMCGGTAFGSGDATNIVEDYNPATGTWSIVGHLLERRFCPTATVLQNGKVLLVGGLTPSGMSATCELYDPITNTSTATGSLSQRRYTHQTVLLTDGKVLVTGGRDGGAISNYFGECEMYDPSTGSWSVTGAMNQDRTMGVLACFSDNTVLAAGGRNGSTSLATGSEVYDEATATWSSTAAIKEPIHWTAGILLPDDRFMATGGMVDANLLDPAGQSLVSTTKCEWYDRAAQSWYYAPELNFTRCRHNGVYLHQTVNDNLPSELLLVAGGQAGNKTLDNTGLHTFNESFTNTAEVLDVGTQALAFYMKMPTNSVRSERTDPGFRIIYGENSIKAQFLASGNGNEELDIMSGNGIVVRHIQNVASTAGTTTITLPTQGLASGAYFIRLSCGNSAHMSKFIVY